ncbi:21587_t:CDS:2 [Gigaspora rosea]|nr:21587_t:CDS:2 [Gigaspora rosea]
MSTKNPEAIVEIEEDGKDGEVKELYLATNPFGNFVVEFELLSTESSESSESKLWKYKFRMYNVIKLEKDNYYSDLKAKKALSYRILDEIKTPKPKSFKFTPPQSKLIASKNKLSCDIVYKQ